MQGGGGDRGKVLFLKGKIYFPFPSLTSTARIGELIPHILKILGVL
jgi:hypothetical protein